MPSVDYDPGRDVDTDLFAVLGVEWGADPEAVRRAWRANSRATHPDAGGTHEAFISMQHAWEVLSDSTRRARYVRAYEARHGPQRSTSRSRSRPSGGRSRSRSRSTGHRGAGGGSGGPRGGGSGSRRSGETPRRCNGTTRDGMPCGNPASPGSDRCWRHAPSFDGSTDVPPGGRAAWRCAAFVTFQGADLRCHYNRLIGGEHCWDHAGEDERRAAIATACGRCVALTQAGRPCRNPRSSLGYPLCDTHLTVGVFTTYDRGDHRRRPRPAPDDHGPGSRTPPGNTAPSQDAGRPARSDPPPRPRTDPPPPPPPRAAPSDRRPGTDQEHAPRTSTDAHHQTRQSRPRPGFHPPFTTVRVPYATVRRDWCRHHLAGGAAATLCVAVLIAGIAAVAYRLNQPQPITFGAGIKATSAHCSSHGPLTADEVASGFDLTCTMADDAPDNHDRPYIQVRIGGCDDWQRLDHDDGPNPVTAATHLAPCSPPVEILEWQVCQTHGGPLPDDCHDGTTALPSD